MIVARPSLSNRDAFWLPFTAQRQFRRAPLIFTAADGMPAGEGLLSADPDGDGAELVFFSADGRWRAGFLGSGANVRVALWDAAAGGAPKAVQPVKELFGGVIVAFSPDGKNLAAAGAGPGRTPRPRPCGRCARWT